MKYLDKEIINDYELINVIKEGSIESVDLLLNKYLPLVIKIARMYQSDDLEDLIQEGRMAIYDALYSFKESYNKTFTKYVELILTRRFQRLYKKRRDVIICDAMDFDNMHASKSTSVEISLRDVPLDNLSIIEKEAIISYFYHHKITDDLKEKYGTKEMSNALYRARQKIQKKLTSVYY